MNGKILIRTAFLSCFCLVLFANTPGFGKLNLQNYNTTNRLTRITDEKILNFRKEKYGFELHCACAPVKEAGKYVEENRGLVVTEFIE
jgi:hypothetical protein